MAQGKIQEIGERLFVAFHAAVPLPEAPAKGGKKLSEKEIRRQVDAGLANFYAVARTERERSRLGLIGRARVAFDVQQRLLTAGYAPPLVKQVLFAMLVSAFVGR